MWRAGGGEINVVQRDTAQTSPQIVGEMLRNINGRRGPSIITSSKSLTARVRSILVNFCRSNYKKGELGLSVEARGPLLQLVSSIEVSAIFGNTAMKTNGEN